MLGKTILGLLVGILDHNFAGLKEEVEGHGAVLFVLGLSEEFTFLNKRVNDVLGGLGAVELGLLLRFFLGDDKLAEGLEFLVHLQLIMSAGHGEVSQVEAELNSEGIRRLTHLDSLDLRLSLGSHGELEGLEFAEHVHVALELELRGSDDLVLGLGNLLGLKSHAHLGIPLLDLLAFVGVFHVLSDGQLVVLLLELNPLASLLGDVDDALLVLDLSLAEDAHVELLVLLLEGSEFLLVQRSSDGGELASGLAGDDGSEDNEVVKFESTVDLAAEFTMGVHGFAHGELGVVVFGFGVGGFLSAPKVAKHYFVSLKI